MAQTDTDGPPRAVPAPQASSQACDALLAAVPDTLGDYRRVTIADPAPPGAAAWRTGPGTEPVTLRCGVDSPGDFVVGTPIQMVDDVSWFRVGDEATGLTTWFAIDRPVIVALTLPNGSGPTPIQDVTRAISSSLPVQPVTPGPPR
jgi:hypothetical protein